MSLDKLIIEGLSEKCLRKTLQAIGVPSAAICEFRALKLLDCIVRLTQFANASGLDICGEGAQLWERLEGTAPEQWVARLFALHDIRILNAHKAGNRNKQLQEKLECFGIVHGEERGGYGKILDQVYDLLIEAMREISGNIYASFG